MKTSIIATIGPASETRELLSQMIDAGMNIARINFSHAFPEEVKFRTETIRELNKEKGTHVAMMQDLCGPRIRVGQLPSEGIMLTEGDVVTFYTSGATDVTDGEIPIKDPYLHNDLKADDHILIEGGRFDCQVTSVDVDRQRIHAEVNRGGLLISNKGINLPYVTLTTAAPTEKDKQDIADYKEYHFEYVALSFVQSAKNIHDLRALLEPDQKIFAKVEDPIGVQNIDEIIEACDGIIIGRGDLAVEIPFEEVPLVQKEIITKCNAAQKPVCVATQALMSMIEHPYPTRAEASDVANAVLDGADYLWLSDESTVGKYPVKAVQTLAKIATRTEAYIKDGYRPPQLQATK